MPACSCAKRTAAAAGYALLDACAIRSLELLRSSEGGLPGSLLHLLDRAATPAGRRKVRQFISNPLYRHAAWALLGVPVGPDASVCLFPSWEMSCV